MSLNSRPPSSNIGDAIQMMEIVPSGNNNSNHEPPGNEIRPSSVSGDAKTGHKPIEAEENPWDIDFSHLINAQDEPLPAPEPVDQSVKLLTEILEALQDSSTAGPTAAKDVQSRFWAKYKRVSDEYDTQFLERYTSDMDIVLIFAGLFSAVSTSFIVAMESSLVPDPNETTNTLLFQISQIIANSTASGQVPLTPPMFSGPSRMDVWVQSIAYLSLASSLLAAFGAVLGKQWLNYYKSQRYGQGSLAERGICRQDKLNGLKTWYFEPILQSLPLLIQFSLLLFGLALSGHMWSEQRTIAIVLISTTAIGVLSYVLTLCASLWSPDCPFQSPFSEIGRQIRPHIVSDDTMKTMATSLKLVIDPRILLSQTLRLLSYMHWLAASAITFLQHHSVQDIEKGPTPEKHTDTGQDGFIKLKLPDTPSKGIDTLSVAWLLNTSTDPDVLLATACMVPKVEWHPDFDISAGFMQLASMISTADPDDVLTLGHAIQHLSLNMGAVQWETVDNFWKSRGNQHLWMDLFDSMESLERKAEHLCYFMPKINYPPSPFPDLSFNNQDMALIKNFVCNAAKADILQVLHVLPFMDVQTLAYREEKLQSLRYLVIGIIRRILEVEKDFKCQSPGVVDCVMVLGCFIGLEFDVQDVQKLDKSPALGTLICVLFKQVAAILQGQHDDLSGTLQARAIDCLGFVPSLLPLLSYKEYKQTVTADAWLSICKALFDPEAAVDSKTWDHLPLLQTSIQHTKNSLLPPDFRFTSDQHLLQKHLLWHLELEPTSKPSIGNDHTWLFQYLQYLCSDPIFSTTNITHLENVLLIHAYLPVEDIQSYINILMFCMDGNKPDELRQAAVRAAYTKQDIVQSAGKWDEVLDTAYTFFGVIQPPSPGNENDYLYREQLYDQWRCLYLWVKAFLASAQVAGTDTTWHERLKKSGHVAQIKDSLTHPTVTSFRGSHKEVSFMQIFFTAQISTDIEENDWKSMTTNFWGDLSIIPEDLLGELNKTAMWLDFTEFFPQILQLTKTYAPHQNPVTLILQGISETKSQIHKHPDWSWNSPSLLPNLNDFEQQVRQLAAPAT